MFGLESNVISFVPNKHGGWLLVMAGYMDKGGPFSKLEKTFVRGTKIRTTSMLDFTKSYN